uniref:Uncharacterized protein n=1 Tax=Chromera velia CCMP2878 TaxID=1169474 RepID=A0A0G4HYQ3_9ALVE|eukprot:Cvel_9531.t1-p1 / transcript=Cvel_9531.t1 / gene=Cvel_9531 / organism=Chromera_velia_CCMP2878 / gene_product=hypothetical protein / transcript_product=hypothetical protein / location=Cvel_scaffold552:17895-18482(+) / protein_length=196 / sequence_SO=supercontig / SO=protein_coding / is_pseudo=false
MSPRTGCCTCTLDQICLLYTTCLLYVGYLDQIKERAKKPFDEIVWEAQLERERLRGTGGVGGDNSVLERPLKKTKQTSKSSSHPPKPAERVMKDHIIAVIENAKIGVKETRVVSFSTNEEGGAQPDFAVDEIRFYNPDEDGISYKNNYRVMVEYKICSVADRQKKLFTVWWPPGKAKIVLTKFLNHVCSFYREPIK